MNKEKPGEFPFTRGIYKEMYKKLLWTMRQYAGFTSAVETNERFKYFTIYLVCKFLFINKT